MTGGNQVVALSDEIAAAAMELHPDETGETTPLNLDESWQDAAEDLDAPSGWRDWLPPVLALLAVAAWTGFFGWVRRDLLIAGVTPSGAIELLRDWATPVLMIGMAWLLAMRLSRREARRFGDAARLLGTEAQMLESRLGTVNRELSLAREFIAAQSRDIEALGRVAVERISGHAEQLSNLIRDNNQRVDTIASVSEAALDNMEKLRGQLPVVASSAKDVTNQIGSAGRAAQAQLQDMVTGLGQLNQFGQASERQVQSVRDTVAATLGAFAAHTEKLDAHVAERTAALEQGHAALWEQIDAREAETLSTIRARSAALGVELTEARDVLDAAEAESLQSLRARLAAVRDEGAAVARSVKEAQGSATEAWEAAIARLEASLRETLERVATLDQNAVSSAQQRIMQLVKEAQTVDERLVERDRSFQTELERRHQVALERHETLIGHLKVQLEGFDAEVAAHHKEQEARTHRIAEEAQALAEHLGGLNRQMEHIAAQGGEAVRALGSSANALDGTDQKVTELTDNSVRLLELIQASVQHSKVDLPAAIAVSDDRLAEIEQRALMMRNVMDQVTAQGAELSNYVLTARSGLDGSAAAIGGVQNALADVHSAISEADSQSDALASKAQGELRGAIEALNASVRDAIGGIETISDQTIGALATRLGDASGAAIDQVISARSADAAGQLELAAANAAGISREAAAQLRDQLARIDELAGNLERRVNHVRERAEEQVDNDFTRRVALITESLNSNAIDIARALDTDVTDTAWSAYLKGDRGIFTRRAVKLLAPADAKAIAQIYGNDDGFRDHVSRYIHDFEAMLRQLLSTRDGHALGVTLLSSDMGKLYVALAQAIERLRN